MSKGMFLMKRFPWVLYNKEVWPGSKLEVARFQKKNERLQNKLSMNKNLYVKNIPENYAESDIKSLFGKYGNVLEQDFK
jgi:RNA recognition motif-containing protein